jgi:hypothetical protein
MLGLAHEELLSAFVKKFRLPYEFAMMANVFGLNGFFTIIACNGRLPI